MSVMQPTEMAPDQTATVEVTQGDGTRLVSQAAVLCHMFASSFSQKSKSSHNVNATELHSSTALPFHFFKDLTVGPRTNQTEQVV